MATLSGNKVKDTFESLLKLESNGATTTLKAVEDGAGVDTALKLSTDTVEIDGTLSFTAAPTTDSSELTALLVDGNNNVVKRELDSTAFSSLTQTFANPMFIARPNAQYTLTTTATATTNAGVDNGSSTRSHEVNDSVNHLAQSNEVTNAIHVLRAGLVKIEVNFILDLSNNTDVTIDILKLFGGNTTSIQSITRSGTGDMAIGFSIIQHADADTHYYFKIARDTNGAGTLETLSTFSVTKLD